MNLYWELSFKSKSVLSLNIYFSLSDFHSFDSAHHTSHMFSLEELSSNHMHQPTIIYDNIMSSNFKGENIYFSIGYRRLAFFSISISELNVNEIWFYSLKYDFMVLTWILNLTRRTFFMIEYYKWDIYLKPESYPTTYIHISRYEAIGCHFIDPNPI